MLTDSLKITKTLIFKITSGKSNSIKISPMSPFLFQNEEIVWKNIITTKSIKNKDKIKLLDIITTYRVFQYDYTNHKGKFILINEIKDTKINNLQKISDLKIDENSNKNNPPNTIKTDVNSNSDEIGDIEIISTSKLVIGFANIRNPIKIKDLLEITRKECNFSTDEGADEIKIPHIKDDVKEIKNDGNNIPVDIEEIICDTCNKKNSLTSKYCIKCGQKLQKIIICKKCDQSNVIDAVFCNICGNKL
ncbi:MAG TPA: zinc ribbon domain-containing protein [Verrucomicrobiae bacterium]|nr:zinc ribbon domain-containing protein [Verrucomicrobiae bacterium]